MSKPFQNVHIYDGKLKGLFTPKNNFNIEEKKLLLNTLLKFIKNPHAVSTIKIMLADIGKPHNGQNYQSENTIDSSDILADIVVYFLKLFKQKKDYNDLLKILTEQLADCKKLGLCPSGRVTRLLQVWSAFSGL